MLETLKNAFKTKEIRVKIFLTLALLLVYRIGCYIPVPGLNADTMGEMLSGDFLSILTSMSGGSLANATLFSLGILPFINAFIIMQLLTLVIPKLEKLSKEGDAGRRKITQITRYLALVLAAVQGIGIVVGWREAVTPLFSFEAGWDAPYITMASIIIILMAGSTMVMWLGERITEYGVGNGTSLIIFVGILSQAGAMMGQAFMAVGSDWVYIWYIIGFILVVVAIFLFIVFIDLSERRVTVQYSKQIKGNKMYGGQTTYIPIRVNGSGVMPIIFASSLLMFPQMIMALFAPQSEAYAWYATYMAPRAVHTVLLVLLRADTVQPRGREQEHPAVRRVHPRHPRGQTHQRLPEEDQQQDHPLRSVLPDDHRFGAYVHLPSTLRRRRARIQQRVLRNGTAHRRVRGAGAQQAARVPDHDEALQGLPEVRSA